MSRTPSTTSAGRARSWTSCRPPCEPQASRQIGSTWSISRWPNCPLGPSADGGEAVTEEVTIELERRKITVPYSPGDSLLQTARMAGLSAPSSCEIGSCGTCMARLTQGSARMINNDALEEDEVDDGWVLTCQALPTSRTVRVVYE